MRLLSYNIHGCVGRDGLEDPQRIIEVIRQADADIVGLQEVYNEDALDRNFLQKLNTLPYQSILYGKTMRKPSAEYGNLLLLREPPFDIQRIELPRVSGEPRGAIIADLEVNGQPLRIINTHLGLKARNRKRQIKKLLDYLPIPDSDQHCILMGDLNEWLPLRPYFLSLRQRFQAFSEIRTFPVKPALFALDRIGLLGGFAEYSFHSPRDARTQLASDHSPLICDFRL